MKIVAMLSAGMAAALTANGTFVPALVLWVLSGVLSGVARGVSS